MGESIQGKDGSTYTGDFVDSKRHGRGVFMRNDGTKKSGKWANDVFQG